MKALTKEDLLKIEKEEILLGTSDSKDLDEKFTISKRDILCHFKNLNPLVIDTFFNKIKMRKTLSITMRKGMLIVFEEMLVVDNIERQNCDYEEIYTKGKNDFNYGNRKKQEYPTLDIIHPEDAHSKYENMYPNNYGRQISMLKKYYLDLMKILVNQHWLINDGKVSQSLYEIYDEVKQSLDM